MWQVRNECIDGRSATNPERHGRESPLVFIVAQKSVQILESLGRLSCQRIAGTVMMIVVFLVTDSKFSSLVRIGNELHEKEHQEMNGFLVNFFKIGSLGSDVGIFQLVNNGSNIGHLFAQGMLFMNLILQYGSRGLSVGGGVMLIDHRS